MTETLIGSGLATRVRSDTTRALIRLFAGNVLTAVAYFVFSVPVAKYSGAYGFFPSPMWPGAGIGLFAALIGGWRMAPGIFLGSLSANAILFGSPFNLVLAVTATNTIGPVVGAMLTNLRDQPSFLPPHHHARQCPAVSRSGLATRLQPSEPMGAIGRQA